MLTTIGELNLKALIAGLVLAVLACVYLTTRTIRDNIALQALQATCALQAEALNKPATVKKADKTTTTTTRAINLTAKEKAEISAKYQIEIGALNDLLAHYQERTRTTRDQGTIESRPEIPAIPDPTAGKASPWSAGPLIMKEGDQVKAGGRIQRDLGRRFTAGIGIAPDHLQADLLYRF